MERSKVSLVQEKTRPETKFMNDKSNLVSISSTHLDSISKESFDDYKEWIINDELSPSAALNKFINKNQCPNPDSSITIRLIEYTYPEIDISRNNFTFKIHDSGYPYTKQELTDKQFDELVEEMRTLPPGL